MFKPKSLAQITASFTKAVEDLNALQAANAAQIAKNNEQIGELYAKSALLEGENTRAEKFRANLEALLGK